MNSEHYEGEKEGLSSFLSGLALAIAAISSRDHLLYRRTRKALDNNNLSEMRVAHNMFEMLPSETREALLCAIPRDTLSDELEQERPIEPMMALREMSSTFHHIDIEPDTETANEFVSFEMQSDVHPDVSTKLVEEALDPVALRVLVKPGTLPSTVAHALRHIADNIDKDRRILSKRYWKTQKA